MLYIHIPYCHHKCTYCGFYSVAGRRDTEPYVDALCRELVARKTDKPLKTIYFGGGTPSVLTARQLARIVQTIGENYNLSQLEEATLEANPENLTTEYLADLADMHFFNRLSIGIQSFDDAELHLLNRVHNSLQARQAVADAADAGFGNISVDLIMGLPGQTAEAWHCNLDALAGLLTISAVKHLSCYELTLEPGSILERQIAQGRVALADDDTLAAQYALLLEWCAANGFEQYEVSNFSRPGFRSRHNSRYWNRTPYIGAGAAAHSFDGTVRRWNLPDVEQYITGAASGQIPFEEERLTQDDAYNEYVMTALRTVEGIDKAMVAEPYRKGLAEKIQPFVSKALVTETPTHYRPTPSGLLRADGIAVALFA